MPRSGGWLGSILLAVGAARGDAQADGSTAVKLIGRLDGQTASGYQWRGIWRSGWPVLQLDGAVGIAWGPLSVSGGFWTNFELRRSAVDRRSDLDPGDRGWTERDLWGQLAARLGRLTLTGGAIESRYRRSATDVTEAFVTARLQAGRWSYALSGWRAVGGATGTYLEPSVTFSHAANPFAGPALSLSTTARAGIQAGRRSPASIGSTPGAVGSGLTHLTLAPAVHGRFPIAGPVAAMVGVTLDLEYRRDRATRIEPDGALGAPIRFRIPLEIGLTFPYRRPE